MISVIITAYNRKDYLKSCLKSLEEQTDKNFDVILITNFDFTVEQFSLKIKHIKMEGSIGEFLYEGIKNSSGEIVSFLDDDDSFFTNKIFYLNRFFANHNNIYYLHNNAFYIGKRKNFIHDNKVDFNMSCISIKKLLITPYMENLKNISTAPDTFFYLLALNERVDIKNVRKNLTYYKTGEKNTSGSNNIKWLNLYIKNLKFFNDIFKNKKVHNHIYKLSLKAKFSIYISDNKKHKIRFVDFIIFTFIAIYGIDAKLLFMSFKAILFKKLYFI